MPNSLLLARCLTSRQCYHRTRFSQQTQVRRCSFAFNYTDGPVTHTIGSPVQFRLRIHDAIARSLRVNADESGTLVEILRTDWPDIYDAKSRPFAQTYYSATPAGLARDEDVWHVHRSQEDRFVVAAGSIVLALWDGRPCSPTQGTLDLLPLGEWAGHGTQYAVMIPRQVHHGFMVTGTETAILLNSPTHLYDPSDEGRVPFTEVHAAFDDGQIFSWQSVRTRLAEQPDAMRVTKSCQDV